MADASFYANPPDIMGQGIRDVAGLLGARQQAMQNRLLQGKLDLGQILAGATNAQGVIDPQKAVSLATQNQYTAPYAAEIGQQVGAERQQLAQQHIAELENAQQRLSTFGRLVAPVLNASDSNVYSQGMDAITQAHREGILDTKQAADAAAQWSRLKGNPVMLRQLAKRESLQAEGAQTQLAQIYGSPQVVDNGNQLIVGRNGYNGFIPQMVLSKHLTPQELAAPHQYYDTATQSMQTTTTKNWLAQQGWTVGANGELTHQTEQPTAPAGQPNEAPQQKEGPWNPTSGILPGPQKPEGTPDYSRSSAALGEPQAAAQAAAQSAKSATDLAEEATNPTSGAKMRIYYMQQALQALPEAQTGGGSGWIQEFRNVSSNAVPSWISKRLGIHDPGNVAAFQELHKYLSLGQLSTNTAFGGGTDKQLAAAISASPNVSMNKLALNDLIHVNMARDQGIMAMNAEWQKAEANGLTPQKFNQWRSAWQIHTDPRVFVFPYMDKEARTKLYRSLSPEARTQFTERLNQLQQEGLLTPGTAPEAPTMAPGG